MSKYSVYLHIQKSSSFRNSKFMIYSNDSNVNALVSTNVEDMDNNTTLQQNNNDKVKQFIHEKYPESILQ